MNLVKRLFHSLWLFVLFVLSPLWFAAFSVSPWAAENVHLNGHIKPLMTQSFFSDQTQYALDARLNSQVTLHPNWTLDLAYQLQGQSQRQSLSVWQNTDRVQWVNMTNLLVDERSQRVYHRMDRFALNWNQEAWALRVGRQAVSWGRGQVFNPMDLFNPFAPQSWDTEYKPGTDLVNLQWLSPSGFELTGLWIPRRAEQGQAISWQQSSVALKGSWLLDRLDMQVLLAKDYQDLVLGVSLAADGLGGLEGAWQTDWVWTQLEDRTGMGSVVANYLHVWQAWSRPMTSFVEYYYNGWGENQIRPALTELSQPLQTKLERHQVFVVNRHYLALGGQIELSPLWSFNLSGVHNVQDHSAQIHLGFTRSLADNWQWWFTGQRGLGKIGSEFSGNNPVYNADGQAFIGKMGINGYF